MQKIRKVIAVLLILALTVTLVPNTPVRAASGGNVVDFNSQTFPSNWTVTGSSAFAARDTSGDYYLRFDTDASVGKTAINAVINDAPSAASAVEFSFDWRPERARVYDVYTYVSLRNNGNTIIDFVNVGLGNGNNSTTQLAYRLGTGSGTNLVNMGTDTSPVYYQGIDPARTNFYGGPNGDATLACWYRVEGKINFSSQKVEFTIKNLSTNVVSGTFEAPIADGLYNCDTLNIGYDKRGSSNPSGERLGVDNVSISYQELSANDIASITQPAAIVIYQGDDDELTLPSSAEAVLGDGTQITLQIDKDSWSEGGYTGAPGTYNYTANLIIPGEYSNIKKLKVQVAVTYNGYSRRDIRSIVMPADANVYAEDFESYKFPETVTATFGDSTSSSVPVDQNTWTSVPEFNPAVEGTYTWSAGLAPQNGDKDPSGLKVSFKMNYILEKPDFDLFYDFTLGVWAGSALGKDVHAPSGTGVPALTQVKESNGNYYMLVNANNTGWRMQNMPGLSGDSRKATKVSFDWMPQSSPAGQYGEIVFISSANTFPYFGLQFSNDKEIKYYNIGQNVLSDWSVVTSSETLAEGIQKTAAAGTGIIASGSDWYHVTIDFNYFAHTADLKITKKNDTSVTFEKTINIYASAVNASRIGMGGWNGNGVFGVDNVGVKYQNSAANDIVEVVAPSSRNVSASEIDSYIFPKTVTVKIGDGSTSREVAVGEWSCPAFQKDVYGKYTWTAELIGLTDLENPKNLAATAEINYIEKHYVTAALDADSLELNDVNDFDPNGTDPTKYTWPKVTKVKLSSGETKEFKVDSWIPAIGDIQRKNKYVQIGDNGGYLDGGTEGIYVFKGQVVPDEGYVADNIWVYFRINYFKNDTSGYYQYERQTEDLDRGLYALPSVTEVTVKEAGVTDTANGVFVSWRILVDEYKLISEGTNIVFDLYRNNTKIATLDSARDTNVTSYQDNTGQIGDVYYVVTKQGSKREKSKSFTVTEKAYLPIAVQKPDPIASIKGEVATYTLNDCSAADIDGDGVYEIVAKWIPSNGFDSGKAEKPSSPTIFDCYKMDGTAVWRLYMGHSIPSGAHFNQFIFYDLDEDGKAEFGIKTGDGTRMYAPNAEGKFDMNDETTILGVVGDPGLEGTQIQANGHITSDAHEYYTVFNGLTGAIIDTIAYPHPTVLHDLWGDNWGNRSGRFNANVGYIQKNPGSTETIPAIFENRGYYARTEVAAITLRNGKLNVDWDRDIPTGDPDAGHGNHNTAVGDLDNDGFDEITLGAIAIDHDGTILWSKNGENNIDLLGHSDAIHLTAAFPDTSQLFLFTPQEDGAVVVNYALTNAATGARLIGHFMKAADIGRGMMANITANPGYEFWANNPNSETPDQSPIGGIYDVYGNVVAEVKPVDFSCNWSSYWDGDLLSELPDSYKPSSPELAQSIFKYNENTNSMDRIAVFEGTRTNNYTKNTPGLAADLIGDWREELVVPVDNGHETPELRIYATTIPTEYSIYSLMQDPVYRSGVAAENSAYNQPPHLSYYLGEDQKDKVLQFKLPTYNLTYAMTGSSKDAEIVSAVIDPAPGRFDKNIENQADVVTSITWNDATAIEDIKNAGVSIGGEAYTVSGSAITVSGSAIVIKKEYLAAQPEGSLVLTVGFDQGDAATITIAVADTTEPEEPGTVSAVIEPAYANFDKEANHQADVIADITWNDATAVTDVRHAGISIGEGAYTVSGSAIIIKKEYLAAQPEGSLVLTVAFDRGKAAVLTIAVENSAVPTEPEIVDAVISPARAGFDRYYANRSDVTVSILWNDAASVTDVKKSGSSIGADAYAVAGSQLVIKKEYLAAQSTGTITLTVEFNTGKAALLEVVVIDTTPAATPVITPTPTAVPAPQVSEKVNLDGVKGSVDFGIFKADTAGKMKVTVVLQADELLADIEKNGSAEKPVEVRIPVSSKKVLEQLKAGEVKEVNITVQVPGTLQNNEKARTSIILDQDTLKAAKDSKKNVTVSVVDEKGKENYTWSFAGADLAGSLQEVSAVSLSLRVEPLADNTQLKEILPDSGTKGLVVNFDHEGILPAQASLRIYVGNQEGFTAGDKIYLYHHNALSGKLEALPYGSGYTVDKDGYVTVSILHCSDYVMLSAEADKNGVVALKNQITVTSGAKTLYAGGTKGTTTNIRIDLPATLELVKNLKDKTSGSAVGAVTVTYKSGNNKIATVDSKGKVTAKGKGTVKITAVLKLYNGETKTVVTTLTVKKPYITVTKSTSSMKVGNTFTFTAKAYGVDIKNAVWTTTAKSIVVIDKKTGRAVAKSKGTDYIVVKAGNVTQKVKVVVK